MNGTASLRRPFAPACSTAHYRSWGGDRLELSSRRSPAAGGASVGIYSPASGATHAEGLGDSDRSAAAAALLRDDTARLPAYGGQDLPKSMGPATLNGSASCDPEAHRLTVRGRGLVGWGTQAANGSRL